MLPVDLLAIEEKNSCSCSMSSNDGKYLFDSGIKNLYSTMYWLTSISPHTFAYPPQLKLALINAYNSVKLFFYHFV